MPIVTKPGVYPEITATEYFAGITPTESLTQTGIKTLLAETPFDFRNRVDKDSVARRKGDVTHQLALGKGVGYIVSPFDEYRSKDAKAWRDEAIESGLTPIKNAEFEDALNMADRIKAKIDWACGGHPYMTEVPFAWIEETRFGQVWCAGMLDVWCPALGLAIDPKCTAYVGPKARAHFGNMGWHLQSAWYRRGLGKIFPHEAGRLRFKNLLIKPEAPYTHRLIQISEGWRDGAERDCERALQVFAQCQQSGNWPSYPDEELFDEPAYLSNDRIMRDIMEDEDEAA